MIYVNYMSYVNYMGYVSYMSYILSQNHLKLLDFTCFRYNFFILKFLLYNFWENARMKNPDYKKETIEIKYLNKVRENQFLKIKNSLLEIEKDFIELKEN